MADARFAEEFWTDPKIKHHSIDIKLLAIYLFTNTHRNYCGLYYIPKPLMALETGLSDRSIDRGIDTLSKINYLIYSEEYQVVWVKSMLKRQVGKSQNLSNTQQIGIATHLQSLHKCPLIKDFLNKYEYLGIPFVYQPSDTPIDTPTDTQSQSQSQSKSQSTPLPPKGGDNGFDKFWEIYPKKKGGRKEALKSWVKAKDKPPLDRILASLTAQIASEDWQKEGGKFIPLPTTWLNQGRWDDEPINSISKQTRCGHGEIWEECWICKIHPKPKEAVT